MMMRFADAGRGATTALQPTRECSLSQPPSCLFKSYSQALTHHGAHYAMAFGNLAILQAQQRTNASCPTRIKSVGLIHVQGNQSLMDNKLPPSWGGSLRSLDHA